MNALPPVISIVGPTAAGKSALALELAPEFRADIVSVDSRQVYRYMDIGTAKPTREEQGHVPHYLIDLVTPDEPYSVERYRAEGRAVLRRIAAEDRVAFLVGGTGFYLRALLDGLSLPPVAPNPELRQQLYAEAERDGPASLHERLQSVDPAAAARIHPHNLPRVVRALEVVDGMRGPVPAAEPAEPINALHLGLAVDRDALVERANARVRAQVAAGLPEETRLLMAMGYGIDLPPMQGFAYRQMVDYLSGQCSLEEAILDYQAATRRYIRRQLTWFRADRRIQWIDGLDRPVEAAREHISRWLASPSASS